MKTPLKNAILAACTLICFTGHTQEKSADKQFSILFGLNQPILLRGFNIEGDYWTRKVVIDYSHGFGLHLDGTLIGGEVKRQQLDLRVTHSLGVGVGYRITRSLNVRLEPKLHVFEVYYQGDDQTTTNKINGYSTFTLGLGAYYRWLPFQNKDSALKGITIAPSIRYWPNVSSSLSNDRFTYTNRLTGATEMHRAVNIGAGNTPWIVNVSVGYTFNY